MVISKKISPLHKSRTPNLSPSGADIPKVYFESSICMYQNPLGLIWPPARFSIPLNMQDRDPLTTARLYRIPIPLYINLMVSTYIPFYAKKLKCYDEKKKI